MKGNGQTLNALAHCKDYVSVRLRSYLSRFSFFLSPVAWRRWFAPVAVLCAAIGLQALAGLAPDFTERRYSRSLYPHIARALASFNQLVSFSIAEALVLIFSVALGGTVAWQVWRVLRRGAEVKPLLLAGASRLLWFAGAGAILFLLLWGFNYERLPLSNRLTSQPRQAKVDELSAICRDIIEGINRNYAEAQAEATKGGNNIGRTQLPFDKQELYHVIEASYEQQTIISELRAPWPGRPKPLRFSSVISRFGVAGIYAPFTGEANYNAAQPDCDLPFSIAHEMAHARGFAREDEANFIAFLVCTNSAQAYVRYSGYLNALNVLTALVRLAPEQARDIYKMLGAGPRADLVARYVFWTRYQGKLSATGNLINNAYLKANRIKSGAKNYNEAIALIIAYYLKRMSANDNNAKNPEPL